jgi:hypothetical protein
MPSRASIAGRSLLALFAPLIALCGTGCSTPGALGHRARDAADIFTLSVGSGVGVRARVGPVHAGLIADIGTTGLRGGQFQRSMGQSAGELEYLGLPVDRITEGQPKLAFAAEAFDPDDNRRGKGYVAISRIPLITTSIRTEEGQPERWFHPYLTQMEMQLGLILMLRVGFNPAELVDFVLGLVGVDILGDDVSPSQDSHAGRVSRPPTSKPAEDALPPPKPQPSVPARPQKGP